MANKNTGQVHVVLAHKGFRTKQTRTGMSPTAQDSDPGREAMPSVDHPQPDNDVVISGMAGLYPSSRYIKDLEHILYNKINPISSENVRCKFNHPEAAQHAGNVPDLDRFDAQFFKVHYRYASNMDAMGRKILEQAYEAIYDAGVNPGQLSGKKIGVYVGTCFSETEKASFYTAYCRTGFGIAGCSKTMLANRISYWLNANGPSMAIDVACCSSTAALEQAYLAISKGECEAAIVGGAYLCMHPQSSVHYSRIIAMSKDGKTKSFDQNPEGCAKSEAVNVLFLQKAKDALRIYAKVKHVKSEFRYLVQREIDPKFSFYRDPEDTAAFLMTFYDEAGISPRAVEYVEAFGSAGNKADKSELEAIDKVFCKARDAPLLVGSVLSNIGYGEAASGISAVTKVLLGYHRRELAGNLHCETPRTDVAALQEGRIKILTDNHTFRGTYAAVNNLSITGVNAHVLLHGHNKLKELNKYKAEIPRLVIISGRQKSSVVNVIRHLTSHAIDPEQLALLNNIHKDRVAGHLGRGYVILDTNINGETVSISEKNCYFDATRRPLWFVYSGMGSQWVGMGTALMNIPIFAQAIHQCQKALEPTGLNVVEIITSTDTTTFDNILHSFVGIAAVQIGLTDVLNKLGLVPDKVIGHSVGELGCAYADGCITAEEMVLSAYSRGLVSLETKFIRGSMAAVGLGYKQISKMCPTEIEVACHNSSESSTISGPEGAMRKFIAELTAKGIFAREVPCSNIAYHSSYISEAGPGLLRYLNEVIKNPKPRSERWVSTSVPQHRWNEPLAKYSSAEYHTNNLLNPVLFEETSKLIPNDAVLVEVAPHGLLQAILKRSLPDTCTSISLTRRGHANNVHMVLEAIGQLYLEGFNSDLQALYPKIEFPVSTGTPFLSHLVDWAHDDKWFLPLYSSACRAVAASCKHIISVHEDDYSYLKGHIIKNKIVLPPALILVIIWDTLAMVLNLPKKCFNIIFKDFQLFSHPLLHDQRQVKLNVSLHRENGRFEVMNDLSKVATGFVTMAKTYQYTFRNKDSKAQSLKELESKYVYQLFEEREYGYSGEFQSIYSVNDIITEAKLIWKDNWVTFIDGMLQLNTLKQPHNAISHLKMIRTMIIDVNEHSRKDTSKLDAFVSDIYDQTRCGGVIIEGIKFLKSPSLFRNEVMLKALTFVPRFQSDCDLFTTLEVYLQIVAENLNKTEINVIGIANDDCSNNGFVSENFDYFFKKHNVLRYEIDYRIVTKQNIQQKKYLKDADIIVIQNLSSDDNLCNLLRQVLSTQTFIINEENNTCEAALRIRTSVLYSVVAVNDNKNSNIRLELVIWRATPFFSEETSTVSVHSESDIQILTNIRNCLPPRGGLIVISSYPPIDGLKDLIRKWRNDTKRNKIRLVMTSENSQSCPDIEIPNVDLVYNVLNNGVWGGEFYLHANRDQKRKHEWMLQNEQIEINKDSLKWVEAPELSPTGIEVTVSFAAINTTDVKTASGAVLRDVDEIGSCSYGMDFSGISKNGERVMGLVKEGSTRSKIVVEPELMWPVPSHWSLEDAATVPLAYAYVLYCLKLKVINLITRDWTYSVLIHGGAGAVGQAAINISLASGYEVFVTVADRMKKKFLLKLFPKLKAENIGNSRDSSFSDMVLFATGGKGVDAILNCVATKLKDLSLKCCAPFGVTFDTKQIINKDQYSFGMNFLTNERTYVAVDIRSIFSNSDVRERIQHLLAEGISEGWVRPLTRLTYSAGDAPRAFRLLAASQHRGRVLLDLTVSPSLLHDRLCCLPEHNHLVCGNTEQIILKVANRLVDRGARKMHLVLPFPSTLLHPITNIWRNRGVHVTIVTHDLNDINTVPNIIKQAQVNCFLAGVYLTYTQINFNLINSFDLATRNLIPFLRLKKWLTDDVERKVPSKNIYLRINEGQLHKFNDAITDLFINLLYFLILESDGDIDRKTRQTCMQRCKDGLPTTYLSLSQIKKNNKVVYGHEVMELIEQSLCSPHPILIPELRSRPRKRLVEDIFDIAGMKWDKNIRNDATLKDLGLEDEKRLSIKTYLNNFYNICYDEDEILSLTLERINEIENIFTEIDYNDTEGLASFYKYVDPDELQATVETIFLPTLSNSSDMRADEFNMDETCLWIVPGVEGHHNRFRTLCERLKLSALVLQPGLDHVEDDPHHLALRYYKVLLKKTYISKKFYLLGFETGVAVALDLAAILEKQGPIGTIYCIGDGPKEIASYIDEHLKMYSNEDELQKSVIQHMLTLIKGEQSSSFKQMEKELVKCTSWTQRVDLSIRELLGRVSHSVQYTRALINAAYTRLVAARRPVTATAPLRLRSQIVLLRARGPHAASAPSSLQEYSEQPVIVYDLPTPLGHITEDLRCSAIINRHLPKEILDAFRKRNLCDSYLLNASSFICDKE